MRPRKFPPDNKNHKKEERLKIVPPGSGNIRQPVKRHKMIDKLPIVYLFHLVMLQGPTWPVPPACIKTTDSDFVNRSSTYFEILKRKIAQNCMFVMQNLQHPNQLLTNE